MTTNAGIHITELLVKYEDALAEIGYSYTTRLLFLKQADLIIRMHENKGLEYINPTIIAEQIPTFGFVQPQQGNASLKL